MHWKVYNMATGIVAAVLCLALFILLSPVLIVILVKTLWEKWKARSWP